MIKFLFHLYETISLMISCGLLIAAILSFHKKSRSPMSLAAR
ncbi:putative holin-like toxin [Brevibacillus migulae]